MQIEAAKHTTPESIRRRIAYAEKQINALAGAGLGQEIEQARETHSELIQVLSERLACQNSLDKSLIVLVRDVTSGE